ncbi:hypothetical protein [Dietzia alimentaria]|uniref:hypothetical protein n=1 Tax=Dietzia alimentaria TaxID=665550 RepID=UPI00029B23D6|nr:hypothetical protein [Dietzia alimentaria]
MSTHAVTYYQAKCDVCGYIETDYDDFSAFSDPGAAIEQAGQAGWVQLGLDRDVCEDCQKCDVCGERGHVNDDETRIVCNDHEEATS